MSAEPVLDKPPTQASAEPLSVVSNAPAEVAMLELPVAVTNHTPSESSTSIMPAASDVLPPTNVDQVNAVSDEFSLATNRSVDTVVGGVVGATGGGKGG